MAARAMASSISSRVTGTRGFGSMPLSCVTDAVGRRDHQAAVVFRHEVDLYKRMRGEIKRRATAPPLRAGLSHIRLPLQAGVVAERLSYEWGGVIGSRLHVVVFTERGSRIRIISLRKANPREEQRHARQREP